MITRPAVWTVAGVVLLAAGAGLLSRQAVLAVKASLAERLIERAFRAHLADGRPHRPWPWADHTPLARLEVERLGVRRIVLAGATGSSLAFAAGHVDGSAGVGEPGNCVIAGHRDGAFAFLDRLRPGDAIVLHGRRARVLYTVRRIDVVAEDRLAPLDPHGADRLTLITCFPLRSLRATTRRLVVVAVPVRRATAASETDRRAAERCGDEPGVTRFVAVPGAVSAYPFCRRTGREAVKVQRVRRRAETFAAFGLAAPPGAAASRSGFNSGSSGPAAAGTRHRRAAAGPRAGAR